MKTIKSLATLIVSACATLGLSSCGADTNQMVEISTPYGTMRALLYDDTPRHRDNFLKHVRHGDYDSLLFHRVLRDYIAQGGDPESRHAGPDTQLGLTRGEEIEPEILYPTHFHKRGAIAAARASDATNPGKLSSGYQFYIVLGSRQTDVALTEYETIHDNKARRQIYAEILKFYEDSLALLQSQGKAQELSDLQIRIIERVEDVIRDRGLFKYPEEVRQIYQEVGGLPQLDRDYTVFGEVVEGFNVLDSINQAMVRPPSMRPAEDIWMTVKTVNN